MQEETQIDLKMATANLTDTLNPWAQYVRTGESTV